MRRIALVTCARSDVGIYAPLMRAIGDHPALELDVVATGSHLSPAFGLTVRQIEDAGFSIAHRVESLLGSDTAEAIGKSIGVGVMSFAQLFAGWRPDLLVVLGDRFDMLPAALAALPHRLPVAHLHGGEVTEGAIDESIRHSLTKLSHLHFVATAEYARRVIQMGEEPWRVTVSGALGLDTIRQTELLGDAEFQHTFGLAPRERFLLVTYHAETLAAERTAHDVAELLAALDRAGLPCVFTYPNADMGGQEVIEAIQGYCRRDLRSRVVINAGSPGYFSLMARAAAMVGNSSSGIIEAPSFRLPVVNIGDRQRGRVRAANVLDCAAAQRDILAGIERAVSEVFRAELADLANPYGDGHGAARVVERLARVPLGRELLTKRFVDLDPAARPASGASGGDRPRGAPNRVPRTAAARRR